MTKRPPPNRPLSSAAAQTFGSNVRARRLASHLTLEELAAEIGTDSGNLSRIERGEQRFTPEHVDRLATALGASVSQLFAHEPSATYAVPDTSPVPTRRVPVVGTAQLGDDGYWAELEYPAGHGDGFVTYPTKDPHCYAVRVKGDSMRPRIKPGEFVVIEPRSSVHPGDEVLVTTTDGRSMVKILHSHRDGMVELYSVNDGHRPITLDDVEIKSMHQVVGILKAALYYRDS